MTIGEMYELENKKRQRWAFRHKIYRKFGYNPLLKAFNYKCAFCLENFKDENVYEIWEQSSMVGAGHYNYHEHHKCSGCGQKWTYFRVGSRGKYPFDAANEEEYKKYEWIRKQNSKNLESYSRMIEEEKKKNSKKY